MDTEKKNKKNVLILILILVLLCVVAALGVVCYKLYNAEPEQMLEENASPLSGTSIVVTEDTRDPLSQIKDKVQKGMILVKMTDGWVFKEGGASSNAYLANSERNSFPLRFRMTLKDSGEVIMESPDVPVGSCIENFPLSVTLDPGEYEVIIDHQQVEDGEVINTVSTAGKITVQ